MEAILFLYVAQSFETYGIEWGMGRYLVQAWLTSDCQWIDRFQMMNSDVGST